MRSETLRRSLRLAAATIVAAMPVSTAAAGLSPAEAFFENEVRPRLVGHCMDCHSADYASGELALDSLAGILHGGESGAAAVAGDVDGSLLIEAVRYDGYEMPPSGKLPAADIAVFEKWVELGLPWPGADPDVPVRTETGPTFTDEDRAWWAIQPPVSPEIPAVAAREEHGLTPAPEADRATLIRRLWFDLIGLPPSPGRVEAFVSDPRPDAYERLVDELLADSRYGERWARHWLDLVRYAEGDGYGADHHRPHSWRYRDYVIHSFNADKPYDEFVA